MTNSKPKVLLFDVETAPMKGYAWERYNTNLISIEEGSYFLSCAYRWREPGEEIVFIRKSANRGKDSTLVKEMHNLFNKADIVIAHNAKKFDVRKTNGRFFHLGLGPPEPFQIIDTLTEARKHFALDSNRLDDLARFLGVGEKKPNMGFHTWKGCMNNDPESWSIMREYNMHDVELLEAVYDELVPWIDAVNLTHWGGMCRKCGRDESFGEWRGYRYTNAGRFPLWHCKPAKGGCGGWTKRKLRDREATMR